jgi:hypothetical protein
MNRSLLQKIQPPPNWVDPITNGRTMKQVRNAVESFLKTTNSSSINLDKLEEHLLATCLPDVTRYKGKIMVLVSEEFPFSGRYERRWVMPLREFRFLRFAEDIFLGDVNGPNSQVYVDFDDIFDETIDDPYRIAAIEYTLGAQEPPEWVAEAVHAEPEEANASLRERKRQARTHVLSLEGMDDTEATEAYLKQEAKKKSRLLQELHASDDDEEDEDESDAEASGKAQAAAQKKHAAPVLAAKKAMKTTDSRLVQQPRIPLPPLGGGARVNATTAAAASSSAASASDQQSRKRKH